jgi:hypothetical protein
MSKSAKKIPNGKSKASRPVAPPGMLVTRSGRFIAKPVGRGTIPTRKIIEAIKKLPRAQNR